MKAVVILFLLLLLRDKISMTFLKDIKKNEAANSLSQKRKQKNLINLYLKKKVLCWFPNQRNKIKFIFNNQRLDW